MLVPADKHKNVEFKREAFHKIRKHVGSNEIFDAEAELDEDVDEDASTTELQTDKTAGIIADTTGGKNFDGWKPRYRFPCHSITVESQHNNSVFLLIRVDEMKQERELIFDTIEDANKFCAKLDDERKKETIRSKARLQSALGDVKLTPYEKISLLVEVVSGWDLPIGDMTTSDPFVVCKLGRREVHRTKHIPGT